MMIKFESTLVNENGSEYRVNGTLKSITLSATQAQKIGDEIITLRQQNELLRAVMQYIEQHINMFGECPLCGELHYKDCAYKAAIDGGALD